MLVRVHHCSSVKVMHYFGFLLKTYAGDIESASNLITSFNEHNKDQIALDVVVPPEDLELFSRFTSNTIAVIPENTVPATFTNDFVDGIRPGYINQEIVKLAYFKTKRFQNYLCLDSDALFITDFWLSDFIQSDGTPFTVLVEDRELMSDVEYRSLHWVSREKKLQRIRNYLHVAEGVNLLTCHGFQILQGEILQQFEEEILAPKGLEFLDLLKISPYEFTWYNYFLQTTQRKIVVREPYFRVIHTGRQFASERLLGKQTKDWSNGYLGLVLNSNFQHIYFSRGYEASPPLVVATYMNTSEILKIVTISFSALLIRLLSRPLVMTRRIMSKLSGLSR